MGKQIGVTLNEEIWNQAQKRAIDLNLSNSALVETALKRFLGDKVGDTKTTKGNC